MIHPLLSILRQWSFHKRTIQDFSFQRSLLLSKVLLQSLSKSCSINSSFFTMAMSTRRNASRQDVSRKGICTMIHGSLHTSNYIKHSAFVFHLTSQYTMMTINTLSQLLSFLIASLQHMQTLYQHLHPSWFLDLNQLQSFHYTPAGIAKVKATLLRSADKNVIQSTQRGSAAFQKQISTANTC